MRLQPLSLVAFLAPLALADVKVTSPPSLPFNQLTMTFAESGSAPALSQLTTYTCELVSGGQTDDTQHTVQVLTAAGTFTTLTFTGAVAANAAGPLANGFFFKITSVIAEGGQVINYSDRFSITGLTGSNLPNIVAAVAALNGATAGPPAQLPAQAAASGSLGPDQWSIPYNMQTGLTKWAPMQPIPPTKISAKQFTPLFPTSNVPTATTWVAHPSIVTTVTRSQTYSVASIENPATPQSMPTGDMAKYLRRWAD